MRIIICKIHGWAAVIEIYSHVTAQIEDGEVLTGHCRKPWFLLGSKAVMKGAYL